jgi:hypothetical protein
VWAYDFSGYRSGIAGSYGNCVQILKKCQTILQSSCNRFIKKRITSFVEINKKKNKTLHIFNECDLMTVISESQCI